MISNRKNLRKNEEEKKEFANTKTKSATTQYLVSHNMWNSFVSNETRMVGKEEQ